MNQLLFHYMSKVVFTANALDFDTRNVLESAHPHQDDVVLLEVVPNPWHVRHHLLPSAQPHQYAFSVGGVGFFRLFDERLEDDPLCERLPVQRVFVGPVFNVGARPVHLEERRHLTVESWKPQKNRET